MKIGLYAAAGFGAYSLYEKLSKKEETAATTTTTATVPFTGTGWQQDGRNRETMWQEGNVFSNANGARRANLQGTDWQTRNMSNACGACGA